MADFSVFFCQVVENSIAQKAGLKEGDIVVRINDTSTIDLGHFDVHEIIMGCANSFVLGVRRRGEEDDEEDVSEVEAQETVEEVAQPTIDEVEEPETVEQTNGSCFEPINEEALSETRSEARSETRSETSCSVANGNVVVETYEERRSVDIEVHIENKVNRIRHKNLL